MSLLSVMAYGVTISTVPRQLSSSSRAVMSLWF